ncbi:hypothetical protein M8312_11900 [Sphingomonas sp. KRR8]|nr:hypothetical protein [Sphingomonas sp. KRR8]URD60479.1 hypothetical protein M8312_11900 [Sphingomonas sp. KRR8]
MKTSMHGSLLRVRVNEALIARAAARAQQDSMTLSELVRQALRRELSEAA